MEHDWFADSCYILGVNNYGLSWISYFEMRMTLHLFLPHILLLYWSTGLYSMMLLMYLVGTRDGLLPMVMLFTMLNIHAGTLEMITWDLSLHNYLLLLALLTVLLLQGKCGSEKGASYFCIRQVMHPSGV